MLTERIHALSKEDIRGVSLRTARSKGLVSTTVYVVVRDRHFQMMYLVNLAKLYGFSSRAAASLCEPAISNNP